MNLAVTFLCIKSFNGFSVFKLLHKTQKVLHNLASSFTPGTLAALPGQVPQEVPHFLCSERSLCLLHPLPHGRFLIILLLASAAISYPHFQPLNSGFCSSHIPRHLTALIVPVTLLRFHCFFTCLYPLLNCSFFEERMVPFCHH